MRNLENIDDLITRISSRTKSEIDFLASEKGLKVQWMEEITSNPAAIDYLKAKGKDGVDFFISYYVNKKYRWYNPLFLNKHPKKKDLWLATCEDHFRIMLQKKIIDLHCQWNANLVKVPGVETSHDFNYAIRDPFNCAFIAPLTPDEIKMFKDFLLQEDVFIDDLTTESYLDYDTLKAIDKANYPDPEEVPAWYDYHNKRTGSKNLLHLPTIRSDKEGFYTHLAEQKKASKKAPIVSDGEDLVFLDPNDPKFIKKFVKKFESPDYQKKYKYFTLEKKIESRLDDGIYDYFKQMLFQDEEIPMKANADFLAAIKASYTDYFKEKIVKTLPLAYEQYLYKTKAGLHKKVDYTSYGDTMEESKKLILDGRVLNGEPRDFNF